MRRKCLAPLRVFHASFWHSRQVVFRRRYSRNESLADSYFNLTIQTSERGLPSTSIPSCASQSDVNKKKRPSLEMLPKGCVLK